MYKGLLIAIVLLVFTGVAVIPDPPIAGDGENIDPIPYLKLLDDTLSYILVLDYMEFNKTYSIALGIRFEDPRLQIYHVETYNLLNSIASTFSEIDEISRNWNSTSEEEVLNKARRLYERLIAYNREIDDTLNEYLKRLKPYSISKTVFFKFENFITDKINNLHKLIDKYIALIEQIYDNLSRGKGFQEATIRIHGLRDVYAGEIIDVEFTVSSKNNEVMNITDLWVLLLIGTYYVDISNYTVVNNTSIKLRIEIPDTHVIEEKQISIVRDYYTGQLYIPAKLIIRIEATVQNTSLTGYNYMDFKIFVDKPDVKIYTPSYVYKGSSINVKAVSNTHIPLNISVYLDKYSNTSMIMNATIYPGENTIRIDTENISLGYHTLYFYIHPVKHYLSTLRSSAIAIISKTISAVISVPNILFGPPFVFSIYGEVYDKTPYKLTVSIDNIEVYSSGSLHNKTIYLFVDAPVTINSIFIWFRRIDVVITPLNSSLKPSVFTFYSLSVNILFIFVLTLIAGIIYLHPFFSEPLLSFPAWFKKRVIQRRRIRETVLSRIPWLEKIYRPKPVKNLKYYRYLLKILGSITDPIRENETLREYYDRVKNDLPTSIRGYVEELIKLYEEELYSTKQPSTKHVKKLLKNIVKVLKK